MKVKRRSSRPDPSATRKASDPSRGSRPTAGIAREPGLAVSDASTNDTPLLDQLTRMEDAQARSRAWIGERAPMSGPLEFERSEQPGEQAIASSEAVPELSPEEWQEILDANAAAAKADPLSELFATADLDDAHLQQWLGNLRSDDALTADLGSLPMGSHAPIAHHLDQVPTSPDAWLDPRTRNPAMVHLAAAIDLAVALGAVADAPRLTEACDVAVEGLLAWLDTLVDDQSDDQFLERVQIAHFGPSAELLSFVRQVGIHDLDRGQGLAARLAEVVLRIEARVASEDAASS